MKKLIIALMTTLCIAGAYAQTPTTQLVDVQENPARVFLPEVIKIKPGDTKIIPLPRYTYIDRVSLEAKYCFFCSKESFRISFDGFHTQGVQADGGFRGYRTKIITADLSTRTIEITNMGPCELKIKNIEVLPRRWAANRGGHYNPGPVYAPVSEPAAHVSFLIENILYLDQMVGDRDRVQYISPAKKVVGKALAVLNVSPETSQASLSAIRSVLEELGRMRPLLDRLASVEATFEVVQEIQSVEATLERMVR